MLTINDSAVIAEISALHDDYERALVANDVAALNGFFWDSPEIIRFGVSEHLYGAEAIAAYRQGNTPAFTERKLVRREVVALGRDVASVMCELSQKIGGQPRHVRQSQVWARLPEVGWKVVAAHVSNALASPPSTHPWEAFVGEAAQVLEIPLTPALRLGAAQNLQRAAAIAGPLLALQLPDDIELAAVFTP